MNTKPDPNLDPLCGPPDGSVPRPEENGAPAGAHSQARVLNSAAPRPYAVSAATVSAADFLPLIEAVIRRWPWIFGSGLILSLAGLLLGLQRWETHYSARAQLVLYDASHVSEVFRPKAFLVASLPKLIKHPSVLSNVSAKIQPPVSPDELEASIKAVPERNTDFVTVAVSANSPEKAVEIINVFAEEAVRYTQEMQASEAAEVEQYMKAQVSQAEQELSAAKAKLESLLQKAPNTSASRAALIAKLTEQMEAANRELAQLKLDYTEEWPAVKKQRERIQFLEGELARLGRPISAAATTNSTAHSRSDLSGSPEAQPPALPKSSADIELASSLIQSLEHQRLTSLGRQQAAGYFAKSPVGYYRVHAPARLEEVMTHGRDIKVILTAVFCGVLGMGAAAGLALVIEVADQRLKTREDVHRVTGLPVLAAAGDLSRLDEAAQSQLAFRTWVSLRKRFVESSNGGIVCGLASSNGDAECSAWLRLLGQAANQCGRRVLTIEAGRTASNGDLDANPLEKPAETNRTGSALVSQGTDLLACTTDISERLEGPNAQSNVHLLVPEWGWNVQAHEQWQAALDLWSQINNLVILVALPPASSHNAVLLAQRLPNLVWLARSGAAKATETQQHLEILHQAGCRLAGAVLSHEPRSFFRNFMPRWRHSRR
ncbi:MAG: hypothetical protein HY735_20065 [Verrucomicrobia bacterium]|nr:hypothetical protein [Verrucomicrobiota bacterium]